MQISPTKWLQCNEIQNEQMCPIQLPSFTMDDCSFHDRLSSYNKYEIKYELYWSEELVNSTGKI